MPASTDFEDAVVHYKTMFPSEESLGAGDPPDAWKTELDRVSAIAFDSVTMTAGNLEGGNVAGVLGFRQRHLVRALHFVRALRDEDYVNPYAEGVEDPKPGRRMGSVITFEPIVNPFPAA